MHILGTFYIFYVLLCILYAVCCMFCAFFIKKTLFYEKTVPAATRMAKENLYLPTFGDHLGVIFGIKLESFWDHIGDIL